MVLPSFEKQNSKVGIFGKSGSQHAASAGAHDDDVVDRIRMIHFRV
jgi:hypothetical protein